MTPSNPSPDTGAGTPLTAEQKIAGLDAWAASDAPDEEWAGVRKDTWRLARSRPATDPVGLDAAVGRLLGVTGTIAEANARGSLDPKHPYFWADLDAARQAVIAARLSVADGPGPEERPLTADNATPRERFAYGRGLNRKAIDGSHIPDSEAER